MRLATVERDGSTSAALVTDGGLAAGTPEGVAWGRDDGAYLVPGSVVELRIEGIGRLWKTVARAGREDR